MEKIDKLLKRGRRAFRRRGVRRLLFYAKKLTGYASTSAPRRTWMWTGTRSRPLSGDREAWFEDPLPETEILPVRGEPGRSNTG